MNELPETILGVSLGMRKLAIAVGTKDRLLEQQIKRFDDRFSEAKIEKICGVVNKLVTLYGITAIAMKAPDAVRRNKALNQTIAAISVVGLRRKAPVFLYDISMLENRFIKTGKKNKRSLASAMIHHYPELKRWHSKIESGKGLYYVKLFEAVAAMKLGLEHKE